jgi:glucose-6-phosphate 1-epimerase
MPKPTLQPGNGDLPKLTLAAADGARAEIYLHGAHITSWTPPGGSEALFLSPKAEFRPGAAIRGGTPIIFPQFASMGPLPKHGFVRGRAWSLVDAGDDWATLRLAENADNLSMWPHPFELLYTVRVGGPTLEMTLQVRNTSIRPLIFTAALHTYLKVDDVREVGIHGLQGLRFNDSANGEKESNQLEELLTFPGEIDRVYYNVTDPVSIVGIGSNVVVEKNGFTEVVTWNPGPEKCAALKDMEPNGYLQFVCVEAALIENPVKLAAGESWTGVQTLIV